MNSKGLQRLNGLALVLFWGLVYAFILSYLHPELILTDSIPTGGDMASHYPTLVSLKTRLAEFGGIVGWEPGNYAGYPQFLMYFPLAFILMLVLDLVLPLALSFKIISLAGVLSLPPAAWYFCRTAGFKRPIPETAALAMVPFLFMEANTAWGGNITSTLAGEFAFGLGLSLTLVYLGRMLRDAETGAHAAVNSILLALVGLAHGYPLLFCVLGAGYFLISTQNWIARLTYVLKVNLLAFCFMGFWIVPLLLFTPYSTPFNFVWVVENWREVFPVILWPLIIGALILFAVVPFFKNSAARRAVFFLLYMTVVAVVFYLIAYKIGVVDVRFIPFGQVALSLAGAVCLGAVIGRFRAYGLIMLALWLLASTWTAGRVHIIPQWVEWNYSGWASKQLWPQFKDINDHLKGGAGDPRVVYEHSAVSVGAGTVRAFENLPFFCGRSTLEGAYIQASLSAPAVFYIQSEVSDEISAPLNQYNYSRFDLEKARQHLELFNVGHYVTVTDKALRIAENTPGYVLEKRFDPFAVFRVEGGSGRYVVRPDYQPVALKTQNPKTDSFRWFRFGNTTVPLVVADHLSEKEKKLFAGVFPSGDIDAALKTVKPSLHGSNENLKETVHRDEIIIEGARPGEPLWIKVSYHPNWKAEGAAEVWRTAPSFMLVFPEKETVRLYFGHTFPDYLGAGLTVLAFFLFGRAVYNRRRGRTPGDLMGRALTRVLAFPAVTAGKRPRLALAAGCILVAAPALYMILAVSYDEPMVYFRTGLKAFDQGQYDSARETWERGLRRFPVSPAADRTLHHVALSYLKEKEYGKARSVWERLLKDFPESRYTPAALHHIGLAWQEQGWPDEAAKWFPKTMKDFPGSRWAEESAQSLLNLEKELWQRDFSRAEGLIEDGLIDEAVVLLNDLRDRAEDSKTAMKASRLTAIALIRNKKWSKAVPALENLLEDDLDGEYAPETLYYLGFSRLKTGDAAGAVVPLRQATGDHGHTEWGVAAGKLLTEMGLEGTR